MEVLGLIFAGTATGQRAEMAQFVRETLGLQQVQVGGVDADVFELPGGARGGRPARRRRYVAHDRLPRGGGIDVSVAELRAAGVEVDEPAENDLQRYVHFRAPDGKLYELVEERRAS